MQKREWLLKWRGTSSSQWKIPSLKGYLAIASLTKGLEDTFKWESTLLWYCRCVKEKVSAMKGQALRIQHFGQVAGQLNSFADHPTASGKKPLKPSEGSLWKFYTWLFSTMFNILQCLYNCQPVWLPRICCCGTRKRDSAVTKRGGEPQWQQLVDTVPMLQGWLEQRLILRIPERGRSGL